MTATLTHFVRHAEVLPTGADYRTIISHNADSAKEPPGPPILVEPGGLSGRNSGPVITLTVSVLYLLFFLERFTLQPLQGSTRPVSDANREPDSATVGATRSAHVFAAAILSTQIPLLTC